MTTVAPAMPKRSPRENSAPQAPEIITRRVVNMRLLVISLLLMSVALPALYFWHRYQVGRSAVSFLARADQLEKEEKWEPAARYLRQYLQVAPSDANVRIRIAQNYDKLAKVEPRQYLRLAIEFHAMARGLAPDRIDLHRRLVEMLYESQQYARAGEEAKSLLATQPDDEIGIRVAALSAYEQSLRGDRGAMTMAQVAETLEKALAKHPGDAQVSAVLAQVYRKHLTVPSQEERDTLADNAMDRLVAADPKNSAALLARYTYRQQYKLPGAEEDIQQAHEAAPDNVDVLLTAGAYYLVTGRDAMTRNQQAVANQKFQQSVKMFEKVIKQEPDREHGHLGLGQALVLQGMYGRAVDAFRDGMAHVKEESFDLNAQLVHVLILLNRFDEAKTSLALLERVLEKINPRLPGATRKQATAAVDLFKAKVNIQEKRHRQAIVLLRKLATVQAASRTRGFADLYDILMMLGDECIQLGQWEQAAAAFDQAVAVRPDSVQAITSSGKALAQIGRFKEADERFKRILDAPGVQAGPDLWLSSVETGIRSQSRLPKEKRDWSTVEQKLSSPPVELRDSWQVLLLSADFEIARSGNTAADAAVDYLRRAETLNPASTDLRQKLVLTYEQLGKHTEADQALATYEKLSGKSSDYYLIKSRLMSMRSQREEAVQMLTDALGTVSEKQQPAIREGRIQLNLQGGGFDAARQDLDVLLKSNPQEVRWIRQMADICLETRDFRAVEGAEDQLRKLEGDESPFWRYYRIRRLLMEASDVSDPRFAEAAKSLDQLVKQNFSWPVTHLLKGMVAQRLGNMRDAVQAYKMAIDLGETRTAVQELVVELLTESDRYAEAEQQWAQLKEQVGFTPRIAALEIALAQKQGDKKLAVRLAQKAVEELPNDASLQLQLGNALVIDEQRSEAEAAFLAAVKLAPDDLQYWNGLLNFYQRTNQKEAAATLLGKFPAKAKVTPAQRELTIARGFESIGNREQAQSHYDAAQKLAPQDIEVLLAGAHFVAGFDAKQGEKQLRDNVNQFKQDGRARRRLAELLATLGDEAKWEEACKLLAGTDGSAGAVLDRRLHASLLIQRGGAENHEKARRILDELVKNPSTSAPVDRLSLARLYEADGNLHEARQQFVALVSVESPDPNHLRQYVDMLLRQGETESATSWLKKLSSIAPTASDTMALQARWMKANGRGDEIEIRMEKIARERWVDLVGDEPKARLCNDMGGLYSAIEMHPAAEKWYRRLMKLEPRNYQSLALCLVTQGRISEVIDLCKEKTRTENALEAATVLAGSLAGGNPSEQDYQAAEPVLASELKKHPHDVGLLFAVALLRTAQQQPDQAVRLYQQIVELSPRNVAALNNMAYVLSEIPGRRKEALKYIDEALQIAGRQPALLDTKGMILLDDSPRQAIQLLQEACTGLATDSRFHFHLAVAHSRNQGLDDARLELKRATALNLSGQALTATEQKLLAELKKTLNR